MAHLLDLALLDSQLIDYGLAKELLIFFSFLKLAQFTR